MTSSNLLFRLLDFNPNKFIFLFRLLDFNPNKFIYGYMTLYFYFVYWISIRTSFIWLYDNMKLTGGAISKKASQRPAPRNFMWCFSLEFQLRQQAPQQERQQKSLFQTVFAQAR